MCGIAGIIYRGRIEEASCIAIVRKMADAIAHRGPDDSGVWVDGKVGVGLGHRRLSILDLSPAGHQPMVSSSGRYVIVFNGEIYNHIGIRKELEGNNNETEWRGHSDTETLLGAIEAWGLQKALQLCTGMFALALWDRQEHSLILGRDRIGEKPLYYGMQNGTFMFGSELKALRYAPGFRGEIDKDVLAVYFKYNAVPDTYCIYKGIYKLKPGCIVTLRSEDIAKNMLPEPTPFWSLYKAYQYGVDHPFTGNDAEAVDELERLFLRSVTEQSIADVPLGAFLSGGVDSSAVVALMQSESTRKVKTFTIGFTEKEYNEAEYAKAVAQHLGTDHHELYITPKQAQEVIPKLPDMYDEPFADSSQIPTFLVSQLARQHVTVSLSGDAGDELFCGYTRYSHALAHWNKISQIPQELRQLLAGSASLLLPDQEGKNEFLARKIKAFSKKDIISFYDVMLSQCLDTANFVPHRRILYCTDNSKCFGHGLGALMATDMLGYLPSDILVKVDRAAMNVSLETRVPLLDYRIVEFAQCLPMHMKMRGVESKWILRKLLYKHVPEKLIERPKMGFGVPVGDWLKGPLREWSDDLLSMPSLERCECLNGKEISRKWIEHKSGTRDWSGQLWMVLMFVAWFNRYKNTVNGY
jgi:asparagine synthase (glutamine-hydrolysing)